ncbi:MAG: IS630 family transposase [Planctomycetota bacterium]|jgi:transposase
MGQGIALRARIILKCAEGYHDVDVGEILGTSRLTVGKWRRRFLRDRLEGLLDEPRSGAPRKVGDDLIEKIVTMTLERKPKNATHWSSRLLAKEIGVSDMTILRVWRAFGLQPHRTESFSLSRDPQFVEKVRDVVGLYMNPPDNALVLCVDEESHLRSRTLASPVRHTGLADPIPGAGPLSCPDCGGSSSRVPAMRSRLRT